MKPTSALFGRVLRTTTFVAALTVFAGASRAQIGSGWTSCSPTKTIQRVGAGAFYSNSGGVETFRIAPGDERCEARINNN